MQLHKVSNRMTRESVLSLHLVQETLQYSGWREYYVFLCELFENPCLKYELDGGHFQSQCVQYVLYMKPHSILMYCIKTISLSHLWSSHRNSTVVI